MAAADRGLRPERAAPLFGRSEIHDAVVQALEQARHGEGVFLLLVGVGGVGKSTLLRQTVEDARERGFLTGQGRALPSDLPAPFALIQDLLRSLQEERAARATDRPEEASFLSLFLAPYDTDQRPPGVDGPAGRAGEGPGDHLLAYLAGPPARVEESRTVLHDRLSEFLLGLAEHDPLLLAVDDLQFADDSTIEFLETFARSLAHTRAAVIATITPSAGAPPRTAHLIERLLTDDRATRLTVRPMTEPEVAEYTRWILKGRDPGREAVMRWYTQTEGNPLFVEYVVRSAMGLAGGSPLAVPNPQDLDEILRGRLRALSEGDRRVLVYATVLGKEFDFPTLAVAAGGAEEEKLAESVDRLVHGGLLREKGGEVYEFVSERIRAESYAQLTETRRRILHRKVARALEARGRAEPAAVYELARQYYLAREDVPAVEFNRRAAELASRAFAHDTAVIHLERALESLRRIPKSDAAAELHLLVELGRVLDENEEFRRSEEVLLSAVQRARASPGLETEHAHALLWLARTRSDLGEFSAARALAQEAFEILQRQHNARGLLVAHRVLGIAAWRVGDLPAAEEHQHIEIQLAEQQHDTWERGHALIDLGNTLVSQGPARSEEAQAAYESAARAFADSHNFTAQARVMMNLALLHHGRGDLTQGYVYLEKAIAAAERSHSRLWIGYCRMNQAQFNIDQRHVPDARRALDRARSMLDPLGDQLAHQQLTMIEGMIRQGEGHLPAAEQAFEEALRIARDLHLEGETAEAHFRLARLALARGDLAAARTRFEAAQQAGLFRVKGDLAIEANAFAVELDRRSATDRPAPAA